MKKLIIILMFISVCIYTLNAQNLIRVNNNPDVDADYTNLQDANDNASAGDTIYVEGSAVSYDGATITKQLTIVGTGYFLSENPNTYATKLESKFGGNIQFNSGSEGSSIMGCVLTGYYIIISVDDITVKRCYTNDIRYDGPVSGLVLMQNYVNGLIQNHNVSGSVSNSIITNNCVQYQIKITSTSGPVQITNNVLFTQSYNFPIDAFNSNIQNNILIYQFGDVNVNTGNTITNNIFAKTGTDADGNKYGIDMNLVFADFDGSLDYSTDGKWQLKAGSPAIGAGSAGEDCGIFGGVLPYVLSGLPEFPRVYSASIPATATSESGLSVTIKLISQD